MKEERRETMSLCGRCRAGEGGGSAQEDSGRRDGRWSRAGDMYAERGGRNHYVLRGRRGGMFESLKKKRPDGGSCVCSERLKGGLKI